MKKSLTIILISIMLLSLVSATTTIWDTNITTPFIYANGSQLTGILGSQISNDLNWINWTTASNGTLALSSVVTSNNVSLNNYISQNNASVTNWVR